MSVLGLKCPCIVGREGDMVIFHIVTIIYVSLDGGEQGGVVVLHNVLAVLMEDKCQICEVAETDHVYVRMVTGAEGDAVEQQT